MIRTCSYIKPGTVEEALNVLGEENALPLAGGTDLLVDMRSGVKKVDLVVDIKGIKELNTMSIGKDGWIDIGATVPLNVMVDSGELRKRCRLLGETAFTIATYQLRNRATMIGNICNASPAADMAPPLYILGARVVIKGKNGEQRLSIQEFITGVKRTSLAKGELVTRVEIPPVPDGTKMAFLKKQRIKGHDLATINMAGLASREVGQLRICIGACSVTPVLLEGTDRIYRDEKKLERLAEKVSAIALESISPIDDLRSSAVYRRDMVVLYLRRLLGIICS